MYEVEQWKQREENKKLVEEEEKTFAPEAWKQGGIDAQTDGNSLDDQVKKFITLRNRIREQESKGLLK